MILGCMHRLFMGVQEVLRQDLNIFNQTFNLSMSFYGT